MECTEIILSDLKDYQGRATLMWASSLAWNGLATAGVGDWSVPSHMFAHILGAHYDIAHGAALSIIVPAWMKYNYRDNIDQFAKFAENVFGIRSPDKETAATRGITALEKWFKNIKSPVSFRDANLPADQLDKLTKSVQELAKLWKIKGYTREKIYNILKLSV